MVKGFIHKLWAIPGSNKAISVHIPVTSVRACKFQSLWPHSPGSSSRGTCTLGPRSTTWPSVDISNGCLNEGWDLVKMESCVVSMSLYFSLSSLNKKTWQIWIWCLTFSLEYQFQQVGPRCRSSNTQWPQANCITFPSKFSKWQVFDNSKQVPSLYGCWVFKRFPSQMEGEQNLLVIFKTLKSVASFGKL